MTNTTNSITNYSFDAACQAVRSVLTNREANALIDTAIAGGSPRSLAIEFGLDEFWGVSAASAVVEGLQG